MLEKVKALKDGIIIAGDGRHDSIGHSAKYGAYTIFCCTIPMILHFSLIEVKGFKVHVIYHHFHYYATFLFKTPLSTLQYASVYHTLYGKSVMLPQWN